MESDNNIEAIPTQTLANPDYNMTNYSNPNNFNHVDLSLYNMDADMAAMWLCIQRKSNGSNASNIDCGLPASFDVNIDSYNVLKDTKFTIIVIVCYVIVILLGAVGNVLVVITVIKTKQMWNATNLFIANLALADIFVCIFDLPFSIYSQITGTWLFGATLCKLIPMLFGMVVYSSTLTLTMIAIDRYILLVHPLMTKMSMRHALILIVIIALISAAVASPIAVYSKYEVYDDPGIQLYKLWCYENWPSSAHRKIYTILTLLFQYFIPLLIIAVLYALIFSSIKKRLGRVQQMSHSSRKTKTTKMVVAVVAVFAITWTPFHIHALLSEFHFNVFGEYYLFADAMLRMFAMSSSCINPLLYGWLNDNYKTAFLSIIRKPTMAPRGIHREESEPAIQNRISNPTNNSSNGKGARKPLLSSSKISTKCKTDTQAVTLDNPAISKDVKEKSDKTVKCPGQQFFTNNVMDKNHVDIELKHSPKTDNVALGKVSHINGVATGANGDVYHSVAQTDIDGNSIHVVLEKT